MTHPKPSPMSFFRSSNSFQPMIHAQQFIHSGQFWVKYWFSWKFLPCNPGKLLKNAFHILWALRSDGFSFMKLLKKIRSRIFSIFYSFSIHSTLTWKLFHCKKHNYWQRCSFLCQVWCLYKSGNPLQVNHTFEQIGEHLRAFHFHILQPHSWEELEEIKTMETFEMSICCIDQQSFES